MAWNVPNFSIPVQTNYGAQLASLGDRLIGAYDSGQASRRQQDMMNARKALGEEMARGGQPNYQALGARALGAGDLEGANTFMRLGQQDTQNNFERQRLDIMRQRYGTSEKPKYGLSPQFGTDANGNPVMLQPGTDGTAAQTKLPPGVTLSNKPIQVDAGTHFVLIDPITRQPITTIPKNVQGKAAAEEVGKAAGQAQAGLPAAEGVAAQISQHVDDLMNDSHLPNMVGPWASKMPNITSDAARVQSRMDQLKGGVFLQGFQMLKGGGAVTEVEGLKAEQAMARLNAAQSVDDYKAALGEFKDAMTTGLAKLRAQGAMVPGVGQNFGAPGGSPAPAPSGGGQVGTGQSAAPSPAAGGQGGGQNRAPLARGAVVNGYRYLGGDPKNPQSWGPAQ